jgi:hypothetical protein
MKIAISVTKLMSSCKKAIVLIHDYKLYPSYIGWTDSIKGPGIFMDNKLHFHDNFDQISSRCIKLLDFVLITFTLSSLERIN